MTTLTAGAAVPKPIFNPDNGAQTHELNFKWRLIKHHRWRSSVRPSEKSVKQRATVRAKVDEKRKISNICKIFSHQTSSNTEDLNKQQCITNGTSLGSTESFNPKSTTGGRSFRQAFRAHLVVTYQTSDKPMEKATFRKKSTNLQWQRISCIFWWLKFEIGWSLSHNKRKRIQSSELLRAIHWFCSTQMKSQHQKTKTRQVMPELTPPSCPMIWRFYCILRTLSTLTDNAPAKNLESLMTSVAYCHWTITKIWIIILTTSKLRVSWGERIPAFSPP